MGEVYVVVGCKLVYTMVVACCRRTCKPLPGLRLFSYTGLEVHSEVEQRSHGSPGVTAHTHSKPLVYTCKPRGQYLEEQWNCHLQTAERLNWLGNSSIPSLNSQHSPTKFLSLYVPPPDVLLPPSSHNDLASPYPPTMADVRSASSYGSDPCPPGYLVETCKKHCRKGVGSKRRRSTSQSPVSNTKRPKQQG